MKFMLYNLYLIGETVSNGYFPETLDFFSIFVVFCGIVVIISKNPIISVLFLIGLFSGIASYLIILGISFIGLSYIIVYVGAVSILFLFILMLINIRISELQNNTNNSIPAEQSRKLFAWVQLPNSGNILKLKVPNYILIYICGWINYSCKVTSLKIQETGIGYRGSKPIVPAFRNTIVKEQRVDGSSQGVISYLCLRCTLMGFERNYQIRILSDQINKHIRLYITIAKVVQERFTEKQSLLWNKMDPWWLTGFVFFLLFFSYFYLILYIVKKYEKNMLRGVF